MQERVYGLPWDYSLNKSTSKTDIRLFLNKTLIPNDDFNLDTHNLCLYVKLIIKKDFINYNYSDSARTIEIERKKIKAAEKNYCSRISREKRKKDNQSP